MTQFIDPTEPQPFEVDYQSGHQQGDPALLVKLAGIFTIITASCDILVSVMALVYAILVPFIPDSIFTAATTATTTPGATLPANFRTFVITVSIVITVIAGVAGSVKLGGGIKLLRRSTNAWGWGLASGIIGCVELWCSYLCFIPLAAGIFTIVILSKRSVRNFLAARRDGLTASFPVQPPSPPPGSSL